MRTPLLAVAGGYHFFSRDTSDFTNYTTGAYGDDTVCGDYDIQSDTTGLLEYNDEGSGHAEGEGGSGGGPSSPSYGGYFISDAWTLAEANGQSHYHSSDVGSFDEDGSAGAIEIDYTDSYAATHESGQTTTATATDYLAEFTMTAGSADDSLMVYGEDDTYAADGTSAGTYLLTVEGGTDFTYGTAHDVTVTLPGGGGSIPGGPPGGGGGVQTSLTTKELEDDLSYTYSDGGTYDEDGATGDSDFFLGTFWHFAREKGVRISFFEPESNPDTLSAMALDGHARQRSRHRRRQRRGRRSRDLRQLWGSLEREQPVEWRSVQIHRTKTGYDGSIPVPGAEL